MSDESVIMQANLYLNYPPLPQIFVEREPKIKVSPYAKFDKYHHKKKKK